jgi:hypothetical protein
VFSWLGTLGKIVGGLGHLATNPLSTVWSWFFNTFIGNPTDPKTPFGFLFQTLTGQLDPTSLSVVPHLYAVMAPMALGVLSIATAARYLKLMKDEKVEPTMALFDVMPRYLILALLLAPGTNFGYHIYGYLVDAITKIGGAVTMGLLSTLTLGHVAGTMASAFESDVLTGVISFISGGALPFVSLVVVFGVTMCCLVLYLVVLMAMRSVILIFGLAFMPIALPIAAYDPNNAFFRWWLGTVLGALIAQIIGGAGFAITLAVAVSVPGQGPLQIVSVLLLMDAGLLFTTKAVKAAEGGAVGGAGMGVGGLVEVLALTPRAARNLVGNAHLSSGSFTRRPVGGSAVSGPSGGSWGSGGGGGAGGGGWGAGPRGMVRGFLFPRHNVSADAVGVGLSTIAGAAKGVMHPSPGQSRSLVLGARQGARMALGRGLASDSHAQFGLGTIAGRHQEAELEQRLNAIQSEVAPRLSPSQLDEFVGDRGALHSWVTEKNLGNDQGRWHPGRAGATGGLTHPQILELDQRLEQLRRNYSARGDVPPSDEPPPPTSPDGE